MNFGKKIRELRLQKTVTQEQLAAHLNLSPQAVSKWENGLTLPDIQLLPELSVYFGVTIDELFEMTDEKHLQRIENMVDTKRTIDKADFEYAQTFLQGKLAQKEATPRCLTLLSSLYNAKSREYSSLAEYYAREALELEPENKDNHVNLLQAQHGTSSDWYLASHSRRIRYYQRFVEDHPAYARGYLWLMDELLADSRCDEAEAVLDRLEKSISPAASRFTGERSHGHGATTGRDQKSGKACRSSMPATGWRNFPWQTALQAPGGMTKRSRTIGKPWNYSLPLIIRMPISLWL